MSAEQLFKDVATIYARLFDHRPAVRGEINWIVKELETKRNDRELILLNKCNEKARHIQVQLHPECIAYLDNQMGKLIEKVDDLNRTSEEIANKDSQEDVSKFRARTGSVAEEFAAEWDEFMQEMTKDCEEIDGEFNKKVNRLSKSFPESST